MGRVGYQSGSPRSQREALVQQENSEQGRDLNQNKLSRANNNKEAEYETREPRVNHNRQEAEEVEANQDHRD